MAIGWAGFSIGFTGVAGSFFLSQVLRFYHNYVHVTQATIILSCAAGIWCLGANKPGNLANVIAAWNGRLLSFVVVYSPYVVFGLFTGPLIPIVLEFATEMTFPIPGDHSAALLFTGVNWVSLALTLGLGPLLNDPISLNCSNIVNPAFGLNLAFLLAGALVSLLLVKDYRRLESVSMVNLIPGTEKDVETTLAKDDKSEVIAVPVN